MNEFIVWDEENYFGEDNQFYTLEELKVVAKDFSVFDLDFISEKEPFINTYMDTGEYSDGWKKVKVKIFNGLGKIDIDGKKIYADCSVVDLTITDRDGKHKHRVFFRYNDDILCYEAVEPWLHGCRRIWRLERLQIYLVHLKVIGTLQKNPELLKEVK